MHLHTQKTATLLLALALALTSCSSSQFYGTATGSSLGAMFGSSIGGLMGGPRGSDKGTLAGLIIGGAIGAAATAPRNHQTSPARTQDDEVCTPSTNGGVSYGTYRSPRYQAGEAAYADVAGLSVENVCFLDDNNNRRLDEGEQAYIVFDIYNNSATTLYNVTPQVACNSRRVVVSAPATIASIAPQKGVRYKAAVRAARRVSGELTFTISFGNGKQKAVAKSFKL